MCALQIFIIIIIIKSKRYKKHNQVLVLGPDRNIEYIEVKGVTFCLLRKNPLGPKCKAYNQYFAFILQVPSGPFRLVSSLQQLILYLTNLC